MLTDWVLRICAVALLLAVADCARGVQPHQIVWDLQDDIDAFERSVGANPAAPYRLAQLEEAKASYEYGQFTRQISGLRISGRSAIYYEAASNASHYVFVFVGMSEGSCTVYVSVRQEMRTWACSRARVRGA